MIFRVWTLITALVSFSACGHAQSPEGLKMSRDLNQLSKMINLQHRPDEVWWQTVELNNSGSGEQNDWGLVAVLRFDPKVFSQVTQALRISESETTATLPQSMLFDWYPSELRKMLISEDGRTYKVEGKGVRPGTVHPVTAVEWLYSQDRFNEPGVVMFAHDIKRPRQWLHDFSDHVVVA